MTPMLAFVLGCDAGVILSNVAAWTSRRPRGAIDPARRCENTSIPAVDEATR